jgi:uncharacterized protein YbjT (DUF2867 family)
VLGLTFGDLFRNSPILSNPGGSPFRGGHQVKWFGHYYAFSYHLAPATAAAGRFPRDCRTAPRVPILFRSAGWVARIYNRGGIPLFAITGASGNTGSVVANALLGQGEKVRVIGRDAGRLAALVQKGAESFIADVADAAALTRAFDGAQGVYLMLPPNPAAPDVRSAQETASDAIAAALTKAAVPRAVVLSSIGADKPQKTGPVIGLHNLEQKLNGIAGLNAVYLRAAYFMGNLLPQVQVIRSFGKIAGPLRPDLRVPMIATRDIGARAAAILQKRDFNGKHARELLGQRDLDYREAASVIGKAIGRPDLEYLQMPQEQLRPVLIQMGMSASMTDLLLEMSEALNSGYMRALEPRSAENSMPTSIETFVAEEFVPVFSAKSAGA